MAQELLTNIHFSDGSRSFSKGDKSLEDEEHSGWPLEVDNDQMRAIIEVDPLKATQEGAEELNINHSTVVFAFEENWKGEKTR